MTNALAPGLIALHSNQTDQLMDAVAAWLAAHPLAPLESEVVLVQSNGMAEWFKMQLASQHGVCAATQVELPARFVWRTYRQVLGRQAVPPASALDKTPLVWRLMRLLPTLLGDSVYAPLAHYLRPGEPQRLLQLAQRLADLLDQYQIYRSDWLAAWAAGRPVLTQPGLPDTPVPPDQLWQCALWQALLADLTPAEQAGTRGAVLERVLAHLHAGQAPRHPVARRVVVFGLSHMPLSLLQLLAALARHSQVLLAVPNPCRYHWADTMDGRELLRQAQRRHPLRAGIELADKPLEAMHAYAHPLLAAWGRQCRDTVRQLDAFDTTLQLAAQLEWPRVDLYDDAPPDQGTLLQQVQRSMRELLPLAEHPRHQQPSHQIAASDRSIVFHSAHSLVRELEVLHDQLLHLLAAPAAGPQPPLQPRDIVVMLPDVQTAAPAIRAVFGQYRQGDPRHIPFDIADLSTRLSSPLVVALHWLVQLPSQRLHLSQLCDLLQVGAVAARLGLDSDALPELTHWMADAGIRWGLHAEHRTSLGLDACGDANSAAFGLHRMLLGYASGGDSLPSAEGWPTSPAFSGVQPYEEVGGLSASLVGVLEQLLHTLEQWWQQGQQTAPPLQWAQQLRALLDALFTPQNDHERAVLTALDDALQQWLHACEQARFDTPVPLAVAQAAWLQTLEQPTLAQRFRAGGVTFCTLMPMRAIPFEVVCLLGMNEGDYPRRAPRSDFDLMQQSGQYRPGDRARRDDDRQLMLDALLSARRQLYISWTGHHIRDNTSMPPSVLVAQLRDYLAAGWRGQGEAQHQTEGRTDDSPLLTQRTTSHPLQAFARRYFEQDSPLHTHAYEWAQLHQSAKAENTENDSYQHLPSKGLSPISYQTTGEPQTLTLSQLQAWLRHPARWFLQQRLHVFFDNSDETLADTEAFSVNALEAYHLTQSLHHQVRSSWLAHPQRQALATASEPAHLGNLPDLAPLLQHHLERLQRAGQLPLGSLGRQQMQHWHSLLLPGLRTWQRWDARWPQAAPRQLLHHLHGPWLLQDWLDGLRQADTGLHWLVLHPGTLTDGKQRPRPDKLLDLYLRSLAAAACGVAQTGWVVARDACLQLHPLEPDSARAALDGLLALWQHSQTQPLPLPPQTALGWLAKPQNAAALYEGSDYSQGPRPECDRYWRRLYPDYAALLEDGQFTEYAPQVYTPLLQWCAEHVHALDWDTALALTADRLA